MIWTKLAKDLLFPRNVPQLGGQPGQRACNRVGGAVFTLRSRPCPLTWACFFHPVISPLTMDQRRQRAFVNLPFELSPGVHTTRNIQPSGLEATPFPNEPAVSVCPAGESFPLPPPGDYDNEFKCLRLLVNVQRLRAGRRPDHPPLLPARLRSQSPRPRPHQAHQGRIPGRPLNDWA